MQHTSYTIEKKILNDNNLDGEWTGIKGEDIIFDINKQEPIIYLCIEYAICGKRKFTIKTIKERKIILNITNSFLKFLNCLDKLQELKILILDDTEFCPSDLTFPKYLKEIRLNTYHYFENFNGNVLVKKCSHSSLFDEDDLVAVREDSEQSNKNCISCKYKEKNYCSKCYTYKRIDKFPIGEQFYNIIYNLSIKYKSYNITKMSRDDIFTLESTKTICASCGW